MTRKEEIESLLNLLYISVNIVTNIVRQWTVRLKFPQIYLVIT